MCTVCVSGYELVYEGFERQHYLQQLTPGCQYSVRVACTNVAGQSQVSLVCFLSAVSVALWYGVHFQSVMLEGSSSSHSSDGNSTLLDEGGSMS